MYAAMPPRAHATHEGVQIMPMIGVNSFQGSRAEQIDPGLRLGAMLGGRTSENGSMNGELTIDIVNVQGTPGIDISEYVVNASFAPLLHVPVGAGEIVMGPQVGFFYLGLHASDGVNSLDEWGAGWMMGANAGLLFPINDRAEMGGMISFAYDRPLKLCASGTGTPESCTTDGLTAAKVLGFSFAALF
jgi:hypothetical protein